MTPDELITRVHRQRADQAATDMAMDALMSVLPPDIQQQWLAALRSLKAMRTETLQKQGLDPLAIEQGNQAIARRQLRLEQAIQMPIR